MIRTFSKYTNQKHKKLQEWRTTIELHVGNTDDKGINNTLADAHKAVIAFRDDHTAFHKASYVYTKKRKVGGKGKGKGKASTG